MLNLWTVKRQELYFMVLKDELYPWCLLSALGTRRGTAVEPSIHCDAGFLQILYLRRRGKTVGVSPNCLEAAIGITNC